MAITTDMSSYVVEPELITESYDEEIMCAGWNPEIEQAHQYLPEASSDSHYHMPSDLLSELPEAFLDRMYSYQE